MKRLIKLKPYAMISLMVLILWFECISCSTDESDSVLPDTEQPAPPVHPAKPDDNNNSGEPGNNNNKPMNNQLKIRVDSASFYVTLENNATVTAFKALLPMTVKMSEMNGNEKYYYLPEHLPTAPSNPGTIQTGDLMLYGSSCLVLFYESFHTSYSYTRLGRVDNPSRLASALGSGSANVTFELQ